MPTYHYIIKGDPVACPRPRFTRQGRLYYPKKYNDFKKTAAAELLLQFQLQTHEKIIDQCEVEIVIITKRPQAQKKNKDKLIPKATKPDLDNYIKSVLDAITSAGIWKDDNLVCSIKAAKYYGPVGFVGQTEIKILVPYEGSHE
jgi:Holliday junction resolvase RusA-like endonuclease